VAVAIHLGKIDEDDLASMTPVLLATAEQGDRVAQRLVRRLAEEIVTMAATVLRRLGLTRLAAPVVLGGGVLAARDPLLTTCITERLAEQAPLARLSVTSVPPIAGAALLGLDRAGPAGVADPAAERRLRAAYLPRPRRTPAR
jgi:N-acetylglucosamine kinase-like BadF-type ATPase